MGKGWRVLLLASLGLLPRLASAQRAPGGTTSAPADSLFAAKNYAAALPLYKQAAEHGDGAAAYRTAVCYENGLGVAPSNDEAFHWYKIGAEAGNADAMAQLGYFYAEVVRPRDASESLKWAQKAAALGNTGAMMNVGITYQAGKDVRQDCTAAMQWFQRAVDSGNAAAYNLIGISFEKGDCAPQDSIRALQWYRKGAAHGDQNAGGNAVRLLRPHEATDLIIHHHVCDDASAPPPGIDQAIAIGIANADAHQDGAARKCFEFAAHAGYPSAQADLGYAYEHGLGGPANGEDARKAYESAAKPQDKQPSSFALTNLVRMYKEGKVITQDLAAASRLSAERDRVIAARTTTCATAPVRDSIVAVEWSFILGTPVTSLVNLASQTANKPPSITGSLAVDENQLRGRFQVDLAGNANSFVCEVHFAKDAMFSNTAEEFARAVVEGATKEPLPELKEVRQFFRITMQGNDQYVVAIIPTMPWVHPWAQVLSPVP